MRTVGLIVPVAKREEAKVLFRDTAGEAEYEGFQLTMTKDGLEYTAYCAPYPDDLITQFEAIAADNTIGGEWLFDMDIGTMIGGYVIV